MGLGDVLADARNVASQRADHDLYQRRGDRDPDTDHRGQQGHAQPDSRHVIKVHRRSCQVGPDSSQRPAAARTAQSW